MKSKKVALLALGLCLPMALGLPKTAEPNQNSATAQKEPAQVAVNCPHDTTKDQCYICTPALRDKGRLWCREHTRYEDRCFLCHPEIRDPERLYCKEHWLYEDECYICHPEITPPWQKGKGEEGEKKDGGQHQHEQHVHAGDAPQDDGLFCNEHRVYERECGICHPGLLRSLEIGQGLKVRFASMNSVAKAGIQTGRPEQAVAGETSSFLCRLAYNQNQYAKVTPLAAGVIQRVLADFGQEVTAGTVLAEMVAPEIAEAKADYLNSLAELKLRETIYKREKGLFEKNISSQRDFDEAEAEYAKARTATATARQRLKSYGLAARQIETLVDAEGASSLLQVIAPFSGTIVERMAVAGDVVSTQAPIFVLADLSTMWLELSIPLDEFSRVGLGSEVSASFQGLEGRAFPGEIIWISSSVNETNRMIQARAMVQNHGGLLKNGMFGEAGLSWSSQTILGLPEAALQRIGESDVVFVKHEPDLFEIRKVTQRHGERGHIAILSGLSQNETVVLAGSFTMKSEYLKSRLGAGCTH